MKNHTFDLKAKDQSDPQTYTIVESEMPVGYVVETPPNGGCGAVIVGEHHVDVTGNTMDELKDNIQTAIDGVVEKIGTEINQALSEAEQQLGLRKGK